MLALRHSRWTLVFLTCLALGIGGCKSAAPLDDEDRPPPKQYSGKMASYGTGG
jgi:hypothetical protein